MEILNKKDRYAICPVEKYIKRVFLPTGLYLLKREIEDFGWLVYAKKCKHPKDNRLTIIPFKEGVEFNV